MKRDLLRNPRTSVPAGFFVAVLLPAIGSAGCGFLLGIDDPTDDHPGVLYYTTDTSGTVEVWAIEEGFDGLPVRLTDGMSQPDVPSLWATRPSWDGARVAFSSLGAEDGSFDGNRHLWVMAPDGSDLSYLTQSNPGTAAYGLSWAGDSLDLIYSDDEPCSNNILRIDSRSPGSEEVLYDVEAVTGVDGIAAEPRENPVDRNRLLFMEQVCGEVGTLRQLEVDSLTVRPIPGVVEQQGRFRNANYASDGTRFTYSFGATLFVHDFSSEAMVYTDPDPASSFGPPTFGKSDRLIYAKWCSSEEECDLVAIDPEAGTKISFGVPDIRSDNRTAPHIGWGPWTMDLDVDGDGLGNGIDAAR